MCKCVVVNNNNEKKTRLKVCPHVTCHTLFAQLFIVGAETQIEYHR